ncbi:hypothetical protein EPN95_04705 [Patescibacteria group bacterium]|nr:MAG: hypothetical protein EPN95_04705 [Patescibacteria group bacterium]
MNKMILVLVALFVVGFSGLVFAGEFDKNPDHYPSIGISLGYTGFDGDLTATDSGFSTSQNIASEATDLTIDARIPVSESWTILGGISFIGAEDTATETASLLGAKVEAGGFSIRIGARYYFNK